MSSMRRGWPTSTRSQRSSPLADAPVNVLARVDGPGVADLADIGVRRVSTGGALTFAAYGAMAAAARELLSDGTSDLHRARAFH